MPVTYTASNHLISAKVSHKHGRSQDFFRGEHFFKKNRKKFPKNIQKYSKIFQKNIQKIFFKYIRLKRPCEMSNLF